MCPESREHLAEGEDARVGDALKIASFSRGTHHFTMYARTSAPDCPICLPDGSSVRFTNMPPAAQRKVGANAGTAVLQNGFGDQSLFLFENGAQLRMSQLLGAECQVVPVMDEVDRAANATMDRIATRVASRDGSDNQDNGRELVTAGAGRSNAARAAALVSVLLIIILA